MRALTLWQPWATGIAIGAKRYETRSWATAYRGPLAIHAAKKCSNELSDYFYEKCQSFYEAAGINRFDQLPFGCVLLTCRLVDCLPTETIRDSISWSERALGNFEDGNFAWQLEDVEVFPVPISARGA